MSELVSLAATAVEAVEERAERRARRLARRTVYYAVTAVAGVNVLVFASISGFFALQPELGEAAAALVVAGVWAVIAVFALIFMAISSHARRRAEVDFPERDALVAAIAQDFGASAPMIAAGGAALAGAITALRRG